MAGMRQHRFGALAGALLSLAACQQPVATAPRPAPETPIARAAREPTETPDQAPAPPPSPAPALEPEPTGLAEPIVLDTGDDWRIQANPPEGFERPGFDDAAWGFARVVATGPNGHAGAQYSCDSFWMDTPAPAWIWGPRGVNRFGFRRDVELPRLPRRAEIWIAADDHADIWCNGFHVGFWSTYGRRGGGSWGYRRGMPTGFDLRPYLRTGRNVIAIRVRDNGGLGGLIAQARFDAPPLVYPPGTPVETLNLDAPPWDLATWRRWIEGTQQIDAPWRRHKLYRLRELASHSRQDVAAALLWMADTDDAGRQIGCARIAAFLGVHELAPQLADWCRGHADAGVVEAAVAALWHVGDQRHADAVRAAADRFDHPVISDYALRVSRALATRAPR